MKYFERTVYIGLIFILIVSLFFAKGKINTEIVEVLGDSIVVVNTIPHDSLIYITNTIYNVDTLWLHDTTFLPTDTAAILTDYFKMVSYDSILLRNDSSITNWVSLNVTQNRLYDITGYSLNNRKMKIIKEDNNFLSIGAIAGANLLAPTVSYDYNRHEFGIGYNVVNPALLFTYKYKIIRK